MTDYLRQEEILMLATGPDTIRAVTHLHITPDDIDKTLEVITKLSQAV